MAKAQKKAVKKSAPKKQASKKKPAKAVKKAAKKPLKKVVKKAVKKKSAKKKGETLMCFLTTACVNYHGLRDDGYELNTLRNYRDNYLAKSKKGKEMINTYYQISPALVEMINKDKEQSKRYDFIYEEILKACSAIENKQFVKARNVYRGMVDSLVGVYSL